MSPEPCTYFILNEPFSEVQSELPDFIVKYAGDIKRIYVSQPVLPESDWPPTLGGQFIRLALIKQGRTTKDFSYGSVLETQEDYVRGNYDKILERKKEISQEEMLKPVLCEGGTEIQLRMLIDGAPGVGKTTLSRFIVKKWAEGKVLQNFWLILLLHLREADISKAKEVGVFFSHYHAEIQEQVIRFVKERNGRGVLLFFDGFDELSLEERSEKSLVLDTVKGSVLRECAVIVTSRPYASQPVQELQSVNRHIEVLGFTDKKVKQCIRDKLKNDAKATKLCDELKARLDIASICQIPLNCSIMLFVYELDYRLPDTVTELYELFILHTLKRYTKRTQNSLASRRLCYLTKLPVTTNKHLMMLSKIAFEGLLHDKLVFCEFDMEQEHSDEEPLVLDLMTVAKGYNTRGSQHIYSFLHLTIQEFLAAFWIDKQSNLEKLQFMKKNLMKSRFRMVLLFFSGITKLDFAGVTSVFSQTFFKKDTIYFCHLLYESGNVSLCGQVAKTCIVVNKIDLSMVCKSVFDFLVVMTFICRSNFHTVSLKMSQIPHFHKAVSTFDFSANFFINRVMIHDCDNRRANSLANLVLVDDLPQIGAIHLQIDIYASRARMPSVSSLLNNVKSAILTTKKSIHLHLNRCDQGAIKDLCDALEQILSESYSLAELTLNSFSLEETEMVLALLTKVSSKLNLRRLTILSIQQMISREKIACRFFCTLLTTFISKNTPLEYMDIMAPLCSDMVCECLGTLQDSIVCNTTLQQLIVCQRLLFERDNQVSDICQKSTKLQSTGDEHSLPKLTSSINCIATSSDSIEVNHCDKKRSYELSPSLETMLPSSKLKRTASLDDMSHSLRPQASTDQNCCITCGSNNCNPRNEYYTTAVNMTSIHSFLSSLKDKDVCHSLTSYNPLSNQSVPSIVSHKLPLAYQVVDRQSEISSSSHHTFVQCKYKILPMY